MANTNVSHGEVKSICTGLEVSPSKGDCHGVAGGAPGITPGHHGGGTHTVHAHEDGSTSKLKDGARKTKSPNFGKQNAKKAQQV
jgi:hypothetical protein